MRFKNNVIDRLMQLDATANRVNLQVSRNMPQDDILESIQSLKQEIESIRDMVSMEPDDFEQQFSPQ